MKRILALVFTLIMVLSSTAAFAAGKLSVVQENFYAVDDYWLTGYLFAKVENTGDKPIKVNAGVLEIFDKDGNPITSTDWMSKFAEYLQPGEYTYTYFSATLDDVAEEDVDDYAFTVTGMSDTSKKSHRFPVETKFSPDASDSYFPRNYMHATITNDTKETAYDVVVVIVLLDDEDNILFMDYNYLYDSLGILPGSVVDVRLDVNYKFMEMMKEKDIEPAKVDAIAFLNVENVEEPEPEKVVSP